MKYGCIGRKLSHSFSEQIHSLLGDYQYENIEISEENLHSFFEKKDFSGINVTIPYKEAVIPYLDEIDVLAQKIGAVNTVVNNNGRLVGYNTDFYGMSLLFDRYNIDVKNHRVYILGTGGTSKTAKAVCEERGASEIKLVSRMPENGEITYGELERERDKVEILINTTPVGMYPRVKDTPVYPGMFTGLMGAFDAVYNPLCTNFIRIARKMEIPASTGLYMLVAQAAKASAYFFDDEKYLSKIDGVYRKILMSKLNIVFIGMPGCGKTTVGKRISEMYSMPFFDSDEEFFKEYGIAAGDYITANSEADFREKEKKIIEKLSEKNGCVISTGGGAVTKIENIENLSRNGFLIFLDRDISQLEISPERPLSATKEELAARYRERYELYKNSADVTVRVIGEIEDTAAKVKTLIESVEF